MLLWEATQEVRECWGLAFNPPRSEGGQPGKALWKETIAKLSSELRAGVS